MPVVEFNLSFYRSHRRVTYERWAATTPGNFRFSAKLPKAIMHTQRLIDADMLIDLLIDQVDGLGAKLGVLLAQLPPSLSFDPRVAVRFFVGLCERLPAQCLVACEPRHATWIAGEADAIIADAGVARVAADPALAPGAGQTGGWQGLGYRRLHGTPRVYHLPYTIQRLTELAIAIAKDRDARADSWCVFDNTAAGAALANAAQLKSLLLKTNE